MAEPTEESIAFYGSLMSGFEAMDELGLSSGLVYQCPAVIPGELFDLGAYPGLRQSRDQRARVIGELYSIVDSDVLSRLDAFEEAFENRPLESEYRRERIRLVAPTAREAWVYFYNRVPPPDARIASGNWRAHCSGRSDP